MIDDFMLDILINKIEEILGIEKYGDSRRLIDTNVVILMIRVLKVDGKYYPELVLKELLLFKTWQ